MEPKRSMMNKVLFATSVLVIASILIIVGYYLFQNVFEMPMHPALFIIGIIVVILLSVVIAYLLTKLFKALIKSIISFTNNRSIVELIIGGIGAIFALIIAFLLGLAIQNLPFVGIYLNVLISVLFAYVGFSLAVKRRDEILSIFDRRKKDEKSEKKFVDTSVLIDGRIVDIAKTGFIEGELVVPDFVLDELQKIADSEDTLKRNRGRRGLDVIKKLQSESEISILIEKANNPEIDDIVEVDAKLVRLAFEEKGILLTNDFNLNKVAAVQGVKVLNINELANAVKPILLQGETFSLTILKKGKENHQGVGYLDDGTMIIVENGESLVGQAVELEVTSIMQTAAGRLIFAKVKGEE